jgi:hypothetical protein
MQRSFSNIDTSEALIRVINASGENTRIFGFGTQNGTDLNADCSRWGVF